MNENNPATPTVPRRDFLKTMAVAAAATAATWKNPLSAAERTRSIGANDRIRIGHIGCGERGRTAHMQGIHKHVAAENFEIVALCDTWKVNREKANGMVKEWFGREAKASSNYEELLALDGLDAVMIATPDHLHTKHLEAAAKAGKHIYIEKPLATEMNKLLRAYDAAKTAQKNGSIVQVGTQLRSLPGIVGAREVVTSGTLGKISRVDETRNDQKPYWYNYLGREVKEADVDWKAFVDDRKPRAFDAKQYAAWYGYYDFCQGPVPQWGAHFLDLMHYVTGTGFPESCVCLGTTSTWKDENKFTTPDNVMATWIYPEGMVVTSSNNFGNNGGNSRKFYGEKGTLKVDNWNAPSYSAEGGIKRDGKIRGVVDVPPIPRPDHFQNWLQCMRSGETPHASIDAGYQHAIAVLMAVISYDTGRKTIYDAKQRKIVTA